MTELLWYLYAESPVHAGGPDSLGALDLPVQREASTTYPVIWGQSLKGALRQAATEADWAPALLTEVFGSAIVERRSGDEAAGAVGEPAGDSAGRGQTSAGLLAVGDAQLVAMPVPTLHRTFAWVTSELALARLARKYANLPAAMRATPAVPEMAHDRGACAAGHWVGSGGPHQEVLGPCLVALGGAKHNAVVTWAKRLADDALADDVRFGQMAGKLREDLLLVGSTVMPMLLRECTEFTARVQLTADKTVSQGPFYSEYLPAETILSSSLSLRRPHGDTNGRHGEHVRSLTALLHGQLIQVGGDETLGKGLVWSRLLGGEQR